MVFNKYQSVNEWVYEGQLLPVWKAQSGFLSFAAGSGLTAYGDTAMIKTLIALATNKFQDSGGGANWIALYSTQFTLATKAGAVEWTAASDTFPYARVAMGAAGTGWIINAFVGGTGTMIQNVSQVAFGAVAGNAQTLFSVGFCDALTAGNVAWFADLGSIQPVAIGIIVQFNSQTDINFTLL